MTSYRISPRPMIDGDLHNGHVSRLWVDSGDDVDERRGLSVCPSYDDLVSYFAGQRGQTSVGRGASLRGCYLVVVEGEPSGDSPWEQDHEALIHPRRIVSQEPVSERFIEDVRRRIERDWCGEGERCVYRLERDTYATEAPCDLCEGTGQDEDEECWECDGSGWVETRAGDR